MKNNKKESPCAVATVGRFHQKNADGTSGEAVKVQILGEGSPNVRLLRSDRSLLACVKLDKPEYFICDDFTPLTDAQIDGLTEFFLSPSDFPVVLIDSKTYKLKTVWDSVVVMWNRESDDARHKFVLKSDPDGFLVPPAMPNYAALKGANITDLPDSFAMVRVSQTDTGLPYDLLITTAGLRNAYGLRVWAVIDGKAALFFPKESSRGDSEKANAVREYIRAYMSVLSAHYDGRISDRQALNLLLKRENAAESTKQLGLNKKINGRYLAYVLRHAPTAANIQLDVAGYADVDELVAGVRQTGREITAKDLERIAANDAKHRFSFNAEHTKIRANYGHSVAVAANVKADPPTFLYHGTAKKYLDGIAAEGIKKQSRNFVHLSASPEEALKVGARHGQAVVLCVAAQKMHEDGYAFYLFDGGVWGVEYVPAQYVSIVAVGAQK